MSEAQQKTRKQLKEARLEIVADLYKRAYTLRDIRKEVMKRLDLQTYSLKTVHNDVQTLLAEWREHRLEDTDLAVQLELQRIDDTIRELWDQWEKSKKDYKKKTNKRKGRPEQSAKPGQGKDEPQQLKTYAAEDTVTEVIMLGDVAYIAEIRKQLAERRKLLGLYAPEKRDITGDLSFTSLLMESGIIDYEPEGNN